MGKKCGERMKLVGCKWRRREMSMCAEGADEDEKEMERKDKKKKVTEMR